MKTTFAVILSTMLLGAAVLSHADDDIGPDQAIKLLESGVIKPFDELNQAVLALHPGGTIGETELEHEHGRYIYKVDLRAGTPPVEWDVELDAATGEVLSNRRDD